MSNEENVIMPSGRSLMIVAEIGQNNLSDECLAKKYSPLLSLIDNIDGITFYIRKKTQRKK